MPAPGGNGKDFDDRLGQVLSDPARAARGISALRRGLDGDELEDGAVIAAASLIKFLRGEMPPPLPPER